MNFSETIVIKDKSDWLWGFINHELDRQNLEYYRLNSNTSLTDSWHRFRSAKHIIIYWENENRRGGAICEELIQVSKQPDIADKIIVLTTNPSFEDVVYFNEMNIFKVIKMRNRAKELEVSKEEFNKLLNTIKLSEKAKGWRKLHYTLDNLKMPFNESVISYISGLLETLKPKKIDARYLDALAQLESIRNPAAKVEKLWTQALDLKPNYYRAYRNMCKYFRRKKRYNDALTTMSKLQQVNKNSISNLIELGDIYHEMQNNDKAEYHYNSALERDENCARALNGLAYIKFNLGDLEETKKLLAKSSLASSAAQKLNSTGINLVRAGEFQKALQHYTKAQYVIPTQDKGPLLFYNIGLCYAKWGKAKQAQDFLRIAIIKKPDFTKASQLLERIEEQDY